MTMNCAAVYENGVLRLREPLPLENGATVEVIVVAAANAAPNIAEALAEIAALPLEADDKGFCGADHDRVLYGEPE